MSATRRLGLLVRGAPWRGRSGRDPLDMALAAAVLGIELDLFFIGAGVQHLLPGGTPEAAGLPDVRRAWRTLPELTVVRAWAEAGVLPADFLPDPGLLPGLQFLAPADLLALQADCDRLLVL